MVAGERFVENEGAGAAGGAEEEDAHIPWVFFVWFLFKVTVV